MGVVGGTRVKFLGKDYGLRHTAGRLKLHFSLALRGGLGCLEASHIGVDLSPAGTAVIHLGHSSPEDICF